MEKIEKPKDPVRTVLLLIYLAIAVGLLTTFVSYRLIAKISNFPGFWVYWLLIAVLIIFHMWLSISSKKFRDKVIEILIVRKSRVRVFFGICIVLTLSAGLAGMGRPLLWSSLASNDKTFEDQMAKQKWWDTWIDGRNQTSTKEYNQQLYQKIKEKREKAKKAEEKYSSWWHLNLAILMWIFSIFYWLRVTVSDIYSFVKNKVLGFKKDV